MYDEHASFRPRPVAQERSFNDYLAVWGRWLAFLPAAVLAGMLATFGANLLATMMHNGTEDSFANLWSLIDEDALARLVQGILVPWAFINVGSKVAPAGRVHVAIGLAIVVALLILATVVIITLSDTYVVKYPIATAISWVLYLGSAGYTAYSVYQEEAGARWSPSRASA